MKLLPVGNFTQHGNSVFIRLLNREQLNIKRSECLSLALNFYELSRLLNVTLCRKCLKKFAVNN